MAINKSKARKIKRRLAYVYIPLIFAVLAFFVVRLVFTAIVPRYRDYKTMAFGEPYDYNEQLDQKGFVVYEGKDSTRFDNIAVSVPAVDQQYAEIHSERLGIDAPVFWGDTNLILKSGVGTYCGSALPGYNSTILMSAHNTTHFKGLEDVQVGDVFDVNTTYARFEYVVDDIKVLNADDASAVNFNGKKEQLVLYTCYPFEPLASVSEQRLFVYCSKQSGPSVYNWEVDR